MHKISRKTSLLTWPFLLTVCLSLFIISPTNKAYADLVTFQKEYNYQASEYDSKVSCRALALEQVKRLLLEELGTYLVCGERDVRSEIAL